MKSLIKPLALNLAALVALSILTGCAGLESESAHKTGGSIPWNRPASWEGAGALGAAMQGTR